MLSFKELSLLYTGEIVPALNLLPIVIAIRFYNVISKPMKAILLYLFVSVIFNWTATISSSANNLPLLHLYTIIEFLLLILFYFLVLSGRKLIILLGILFTAFAIINSLIVQNIYDFNSYSRGIEALIIIIFCLMYISKSNPDETWSKKPENWSNAGILLYFSGALSQFAFSNIVSANAPMYFKMIIWDIHATFVLVMYVFFSIGFLKYRE